MIARTIIAILSFIFFTIGVGIIGCAQNKANDVDLDRLVRTFEGLSCAIAGLIILCAVMFTPYYKNICRNNHVAPELVEACEQYTDINKEQLAYYFSTIANSGNDIDLPNSIHLLDSELTDEDVTSIINLSDNLQEN